MGLTGSTDDEGGFEVGPNIVTLEPEDCSTRLKNRLSLKLFQLVTGLWEVLGCSPLGTIVVRVVFLAYRRFPPGYGTTNLQTTVGSFT